MKRRPLPVPQYEFGFAAEAFALLTETTLDGERLTRERAEAEQARRAADAAQPPLFAPPAPKAPKAKHPFRLRAGDLIALDRRTCEVVRVTDCAAVVAVARPSREFTTILGKRVRLQPKPALVRISPNSETPILNR